MRKVIFTSLILSTPFCFCNEEMRGMGAKIDIRHKEQGGIGYDKGYTTVDLLCLGNSDHFEALVNVRGHLFNDRNLAGNIGCGFRFPFYRNKYLVGANVYYDCRRLPLGIIQQLGMGAEWIGAVDFRINWYMPIGQNIVLEKKLFSRFSNNTSIIDRRVLGALPVIEGEVGIPFKNVYLRVGPYYFYEQKKHDFSFGKQWGGRVSADINIGKYVSLGCSASYDKIFKHNFQGRLSFQIPLSRSKPPVGQKRNLRLVPIMRNEIIPLQIKEKTEPLSTLKNEEVRFVFVNNIAPVGGDGSIEKPFSYLKDAEKHSSPGDVICVFPGDGTSKHMDEGIVLQEHQRLVSSAAEVEVEGLVIPASTPGQKPVIGPVVAATSQDSLLDFFFAFTNFFKPGNLLRSPGEDLGNFTTNIGSFEDLGSSSPSNAHTNGDFFLEDLSDFKNIDLAQENS